MLQNKSKMLEGYQARRNRYLGITGILLLIMILLALAMMSCGNTNYSPAVVVRTLLGEEIKGASFTIRTLRLPRMLAGLFCGIAFGMAGNTFQKLLGNPLASPDIIGISSGASVAAVFAILVLQLNQTMVSFVALLSGLLVSGIIYRISHENGFSNGKLILTGIGMQAFLNALLSWLLLRASQYNMADAIHWLSGSLNGIRMSNIPALVLAVVIFGGCILLLERHLSVMQLGDAYAATLGVKVKRIRFLLMFFSLFLIAFATSVTGPLASAAFLSGPIAARISGGGRNHTISSALTGAILVMGADCLGQFGLPYRYPAGILTGLMGAPYLVYLLIRINKKGV